MLGAERLSCGAQPELMPDACGKITYLVQAQHLLPSESTLFRKCMGKMPSHFTTTSGSESSCKVPS